jgi:predicted permease
MGFGVGFAPPIFAEIREEPMVLDVAAYHAPSMVQAAEGGEWRAADVTYSLADVLAIRPIVGRAFVPDDAEPAAPRVALISEAAWRNRFGSDPGVIGRELTPGGERVRVIGVMPAALSVPTPDTELWQPLKYTPEELAPSNSLSFGGDGMVARLASGITAPQLQDALRARYQDVTRTSAHHVWELMGLELNVQGLREAWTADQRAPLTIIGLASLLVLAGALFNVAGLWLTRLLGRSHEHALQAALGAGGFRRLARTCFEFLLLGAAGACVALALAPVALRWLADIGVLDTNQPLAIRTGPATAVITVVVLVASSVPVLATAAWQQRRQRHELLTDLGGGGRGAAGTGARVRRVLIVAQVALAMSILCAMGLLLRSWHGLLTEDLGFEPRSLLVADIRAVGVENPRQPDPRVAAALEALRGIPGVREAAHTNVAPFGGSESVNSIPEPGQAEQQTTVRTRNVGERYFETVGIPIRSGRPFEPGDTGVIVDEYFADRYFPDGAVGEFLRIDVGPGELRERGIVGVAATAKYRAPDEQPNQGTLYSPSADPAAIVTAVIATTVPPATLTAAVRATLETILGPDRLGRIVTMETLVRRTVRDREPQLILLSVFGVEALALAGVGLFSLLAYSVRARTAEFGVRQAVGAKPADIRRQVLADAGRMLIPGLAAGVVGAWAAGRLVANRLYEVSPVDPLTWAATALLLALVVVIAGLWPAERAARIQPTEALRHE